MQLPKPLESLAFPAPSAQHNCIVTAERSGEERAAKSKDPVLIRRLGLERESRLESVKILAVRVDGY
jgi:hypothetical protein